MRYHFFFVLYFNIFDGKKNWRKFSPTVLIQRLQFIEKHIRYVAGLNHGIQKNTISNIIICCSCSVVLMFSSFVLTWYEKFEITIEKSLFRTWKIQPVYMTMPQVRQVKRYDIGSMHTRPDVWCWPLTGGVESTV